MCWIIVITFFTLFLSRFFFFGGITVLLVDAYLQGVMEVEFVSVGIRMNGRIRGFPTKYHTVERWTLMIILNYQWFNLVVYPGIC